VSFAGRSPRTYLTDADEVFRAEIRTRWRVAKLDRRPLDGDLRVHMLFAGNSVPSKGRHAPQPDVSNLIKAVEDAGNPNEELGWGGLWGDDRQIRCVKGELREWGRGVRPLISLRVWSWSP
jgi:Holliday junction resolvase RusA-like endonuclease